jgi:basic membrane protein A
MNRQHCRVVFAVAVVLVIALSACGKAAAPVEPVEEKTKVALVLPGLITDDSWCEQAYEGLVQAEKECNVEIAYTEQVSLDEHIEVMRGYAAEGYDYIIGHGGEFYDALETVAAEYPDIRFNCTNGVDAHDNLSSHRISYRQLGYVAGVVACEVSESGKVGILIGMPNPVLESGLEGYQLAAEACGNEVTAIYTGSFDDVEKAREASLALVADGVDVFYHELDSADAGVFSAAQDEGVWAIGQGKDQRYLAPDAVVASVMGSIPGLIYDVACGKVPAGEVAYQDVTNYITVKLEEDQLPEDVRQKILDTLEKMKTGEINIEP